MGTLGHMKGNNDLIISVSVLATRISRFEKNCTTQL